MIRMNNLQWSSDTKNIYLIQWGRYYDLRHEFITYIPTHYAYSQRFPNITEKQRKKT